MDIIFRIWNYFASIQASRGDDALRAEWKAKQLRAWVISLILVSAFCFAFLVGSALQTFDENALLHGLSEHLRPTAAYVVGGGLVLLTAYSAFCWGAVFWFMSKHGGGA